MANAFDDLPPLNQPGNASSGNAFADLPPLSEQTKPLVIGPYNTAQNPRGDFTQPEMRSASAPTPNGVGNPLVGDTLEHAAPFGASLKASLAPDVQDQIAHYSQSMGIPRERFGVIDGNIVYADQSGHYQRVTPSVFGGSNLGEDFMRLGRYVGANTGGSVPQIAGAAVGTAVGPTMASIPAAAATATGVDAARQAVSNYLLGKNPTDLKNYDITNSLGHGLEAGAGQALAVGANKLLGRNPLGLVASERGAATDPSTLADIQNIQDEASKRGINLSFGQASQMRSALVNERVLGRDPATMDQIFNFYKEQQNSQVPAAVRSEISGISPKTGDEGITAFRSGAEATVNKSLQDRAAAAGPLYDQAFQGGSIAPLEDQLRTSLQQATSAKGQVAKQIAQIEKDSPGALISKGAAGAQTRARYMDLQKQLTQAESDRQAILQKFQQAKMDASANAPGAVWNPRIQQFLDDPVIQKGLARGIEIQRLESLAKGQPFNPTEYAITGTDEAGKPIVGNVPNMRTLDAAKRGLDAIIKEQVNPLTGKLSDYGRAVDMVRRSYLSELDKVNPAYATARNAFSAGSDALGDILNGGVGAINKMDGMNRQSIVSRMFSATNITPENVAKARGQFQLAGKLDDWNAGVASFLSDKLDQAMKFNASGNRGNVAGKYFASVWGDQRQQDIVKAALGPDKAESFGKLMEVLRRAGTSLPEGAPTATDLAAANQSTVGKLGKTAAALTSGRTYFNPGESVKNAIEALRTSDAAKQKLASALLSGNYDKQLAQLRMLSPTSQRALTLATGILTDIGVGLSGARTPRDFLPTSTEPMTLGPQ